jgi:multiple sugar transport system permease protein
VSEGDVRRRLRRNRPRLFAVCMVLPAVIVLVAVIAFPLGDTLRNSFFHTDRFDAGTPPFFVGLQNYIDVLSDRSIRTAVGNTFYFVSVTVFLEFLLGTAVALLLMQSRGRSLWMRTLFLFPLMIAPIVAGLQWRWLFADQYGVINYFLKAFFAVKNPPLWLADPHVAMFSLMIVDIWLNFPFVMLVMFAALSSVPEELSESALVDGATYAQRLLFIKVPYIASSIIVVLLIRIMDAFRIFDSVYVLTRGGPGVSTETISMYTYQIAFTNLDFEKAGSLSLLATMLLIALSVVLARVLRKNQVF